MRGNGDCGVGLTVMWNRHFDDELKRLTDMNGILEGPRCGACGTRYLVASPEEFIFNGANGKPGKKQGEKGKKPRTVGMKPGGVPGARSVRVIHAPCRSKPVARFTVSSEHRRQIEFPKEHWFNLVGKERDSRNSFDGIMTRETYTKAASLAVLKATLPRGKITLVGEHKSKMARVVPHIFHEEILADRLRVSDLLCNWCLVHAS